ncbi:skin secretory protein xP2-like [Cuculus canorus]|uniref:skin secretory protein xP2-like n=1 Tax=Cuculus canorus TaxID=55661 RepID=UPI0023AA4E8E|nr:skin secretory protein xP2-like [Cuculus canorus]
MRQNGYRTKAGTAPATTDRTAPKHHGGSAPPSPSGARGNGGRCNGAATARRSRRRKKPSPPRGRSEMRPARPGGNTKEEARALGRSGAASPPTPKAAPSALRHPRAPRFGGAGGREGSVGERGGREGSAPAALLAFPSRGLRIGACGSAPAPPRHNCLRHPRGSELPEPPHHPMAAGKRDSAGDRLVLPSRASGRPSVPAGPAALGERRGSDPPPAHAHVPQRRAAIGTAARPPPPHRARPLPVSARREASPRRPALRESRGPATPATNKRAAIPPPRLVFVVFTYPVRAAMEEAQAAGVGRRPRSTTSVAGRENGVCENPALCVCGGGGWAAAALAIFQSARAPHGSDWPRGLPDSARPPFWDTAP